jgi:hypothetical protein
MGPIVGLSGPFSRRAPGDCPRCKRRVEATWPWRGWGPVRRAWLFVIGAIVVASPIVMSDVYTLLPGALILVVVIGPLNGLAAIQPTCLRCGCVVEPIDEPAIDTPAS